MKARLYDKYVNDVRLALKDKLKKKNVHEVPRMEKIVINMGVSAQLEKAAVDDAAKDLAMIGLDRLAGYFGVQVLNAWGAERRALRTVPQITAGPVVLNSSARGLAINIKQDRIFLIWIESGWLDHPRIKRHSPDIHFNKFLGI